MVNYIVEPRTKEIQQYGLEILSSFHKICEDNDLKYILDFGTLLGAIRHDGFIPWDDDIDVAMPRNDFEKFAEIAEKSLPHNMFLQTHQSDPNYYNYIAKIRIPNNQYTENAMQYFEIIHGPWLDIFIYDYAYDKKELEKHKQKLYNKQRNFYPKMMESLVTDPSQNYSILEKIFKNIFRFAIRKSQARKERGFLMHYLDKQYKKLDTLIRKTPQKNSSGKMITYTFPIHSENDEKGLRLNDDHFKNRKLHKFKDNYFYIPVDYHQLLVDRYDNYMELPPYQDRKSNHQWVD